MAGRLQGKARLRSLQSYVNLKEVFKYYMNFEVISLEKDLVNKEVRLGQSLRDMVIIIHLLIE